MKLREHPSRGQWPPDWSGNFQGADKLAVGEVGTLFGVKLHLPPGADSGYIMLEIEYQRNLAFGFLRWQDMSTIEEVARRLKNRVGMNIKEVGDVDLP